MATMPLPVSDIISVSVSVAQAAIASKSFNQGLIVGDTTVIPSYGSNPRLRQYASTSAMLTDGFTNSDPEYLAATAYFSAAQPPQFVWIGRQDGTAIQTAIPHSGNAGSGYVVGDKITVTQVGASNGILTVSTIGEGGVVTGLTTSIGNQGTGYSVATGLTTTGGSGTGLEVDITAIGETLLQAVEACSLANQQWYPFMCCGAVDADNLALAAWSTANWQTALYFFASSDAGIPAGTANNIALQMQAQKYLTLGIYSTTQNGLYPDNLYTAAAAMGEACGLNTGLAGSYFTLNLKPMVEVGPEPLTQTQFNAITSANFNVVGTFGPYQGYLSSGILSSGDYFDQILFRAMLVNLIQTNLMNLLISTPSIPQTNPGEGQLLHQVDLACATVQSIGYLAAGTWDGATISVGANTGITNGQSLPNGYLNFAASYATQSKADRAARKAMPIYCCILEAGAVQSVTIQVLTQL